MENSAYSPGLLEHYRAPRNVGVLPDADGTATRQNQVCGDVLQFFVRLSGETVDEVRFKAEGCIPTVALASYTTEWLRGKKKGEIERLDLAHFEDALGSLPPHKIHAAALVVETLRAALCDCGRNPH
ncbi:MAG TPA: iron-sulfur cluster assembly scaffold protein [Acidobacteriota bacterium]|jgi:nitrogen fixation NifU-like protein